MSITREESELLDKRDTLTDDEKGIIDDAFDVIYQEGKRLNLKLAGDDRAARLEAAMVRFLIESRS